MKIITENTFVVFDLDDTLYKENSYHDSGLREVASLVKKLYAVDIEDQLFRWKAAGETDIFGLICSTLELNSDVKKSLIWHYRLHYPSIRLDSAIRDLLCALKKQTSGVAILTDGRSVTQRLKLSALGLERIPTYISEEWCSVKPEHLRFQEIMKEYPAGDYLYVGDNPAKDFRAPNELGWVSFGLRGDDLNVHDQECSLAGDEPHYWLNALTDLVDYYI